MAQDLPFGQWKYNPDFDPEKAPRVVIDGKTYVPVEFLETAMEMKQEAFGMTREALEKVAMSTADMRAERLGHKSWRKQ